MRVGIVGSREYPQSLAWHVGAFVLALPQDWEIVSGAQAKGVDGFARKAALAHGRTLVEFPPDHYPKGPYGASVCPLTGRAIHYNSNYNARYYIVRNRRIAFYCDFLAGFVREGLQSRGTEHTLRFGDDYGKKVVRFTDAGFAIEAAREVIAKWISEPLKKSSEPLARKSRSSDGN